MLSGWHSTIGAVCLLYNNCAVGLSSGLTSSVVVVVVESYSKIHHSGNQQSKFSGMRAQHAAVHLALAASNFSMHAKLT
jgi:hypothetical protein